MDGDNEPLLVRGAIHSPRQTMDHSSSSGDGPASRMLNDGFLYIRIWTVEPVDFTHPYGGPLCRGEESFDADADDLLTRCRLVSSAFALEIVVG